MTEGWKGNEQNKKWARKIITNLLELKFNSFPAWWQKAEKVMSKIKSELEK